MRRPLVLPKCLGALRITEPVGVHEIEERLAAIRLNKFRQIGVCSARIAVLIISAVAVIWPESVDGP